MDVINLHPRVQKNNASTYLILAGKFWFITATIGLYAFGAYIILYYATTALANHFEIWNKNLFSGILPNDWLGNFLLVFHILLASVILFGGPLQFMPFIRNRFRTFHRYLGRTYLTLSVLIGLSGLVMTFKGKSFGTPFQQTINSLTTIYICWFAIMTFKNAIRKNFDAHPKWALRLFMATNAVWFIRVWSNSWRILNNGYFEFNPDNFLSIITYLIPLPLVILELYYLALKKNQAGLQWIVTGLIFLFTLIMTVGIYGAINRMWLSRVVSVF